MDVANEFIKHLNKTLEYAVNNHAALAVTMQLGLLEVLKEEAGKRVM